jgi:diguanylate cyclase (GGDEF)-like protein
LPVLGIIALIATSMLVSNARSRMLQNDRQFESAQQLRLQEIEIRVDDYFSKAIQLVGTGAEALTPVHGDTAAVKRIVAELFRSRRSSQIFGAGVFYAPDAFDGKPGPFSVYDSVLAHGRIELSMFDPRVRPYTRYRWYQRAAKAGPNNTIFDGPYIEEGISYISTVLAFDQDGHLAGVVAVDTLTQTFKNEDLMARQLGRGEIAWVESSTRGRWLLGTARLPKNGDLIDRVIPLRYTGAYIHLSGDASALHAANARIVNGTAAFASATWLFASVLALALMQSWRSRERAQVLEQERGRLETQIAVGKQVEAELRKAALTDALTNLPNRAAFLERASAIIADPGERKHAVLFIDLDRFNMVNETLGHLSGDELLKMIAERLRSALDQEAWVARLGGDEFVVIAPVEPPPAGALADCVLTALREPLLLGGRLVYSTASIGVLVVDSSYGRPEELLRDSDIAMYEAKHRGRGCYIVFDEAMRRQVAAQSDLENALRRAIRRHEFLPYYQPIVDVGSQEPVSFEALVRWERPGRGIVEASEFIPYAERCGLVDAIDDTVLEGVCNDAVELFERFPNATVQVNLSAAHLNVPGLADAIDAVLNSHGVSPSRIKLEITETAIMSDADRAQATLQALRQKGLQIVVDDFGAGHSSLAYLHRLPIAGLKIDRSFVAPLAQDEQAVAIVRSIVALASTLGLYTVAEGVETGAQLDILRQLGVAHAQGFFFSPAVALRTVIAAAQRFA